MTDEQEDRRWDKASTDLSRRGFVSLSVAASFGAVTPSVSGKELVVETNVDVKTPDGTCDAVFIHPTTGSHPGVLVWHDSLGLRQVIRDLGKRIAGEGYSVLVPNLFCRSAPAPLFDASFNYANPADREKYGRIVAPFLATGAAERDAVAYVAFLDGQRQVNRKRKNRNSRLLSGRSFRHQNSGGGARPRGSRRVVPRRLSGHRPAEQPALPRTEDQGAPLFCDCIG